MTKMFGLGLAATAIWLFWAVGIPILSGFGFIRPYSDLGLWGDSFGALSSLFSAGAFIGALYAIQKQQSQIDQARRDQDKINTDAQAEQHRQQFETSFFKLLDLLRELRNEVKFIYRGENVKPDLSTIKTIHTHEGAHAFSVAWGQIIVTLNRAGATVDRGVVGRIYNDVIHNEHEESFSPYFRLLYTILTRIKDDNYLTQSNKLQYAKLLRS